MPTPIRPGRPPALAALAALAALLAGAAAGCGPDPDRKVTVAGKVTLAGQPLTKGEVVLIPDEARGNTRIDCPMADIQPDGSYAVELRGEGGAAMGPYKVMVMATSNKVEVRPGWVPVWIVHPKYTRRDTTDLTIEVVERPAPGAYDLAVTPP